MTMLRLWIAGVENRKVSLGALIDTFRWVP
jgi:hypothetical protein